LVVFAERGAAWRRLLLVGAVAVGIAAAPAAGSTVGASSSPTGTVITTAEGAFGTMLVVGSGKYAGYTLYFISSDQPGTFACTATIVKSLPGGPGSCTGPSNDQKAEWPAITTDGAPIAGAGVDGKLLGSVNRTGIGDQVTYAGHPLYLFDQGPGQLTGEGWDEPSLPPWHGVWWLMAPSGVALPWTGTLTTTTLNHKTVLAVLMLTGIGWEPFPVYSYSSDTSSTSKCTGSCAAAWPPLLDQGTPSVLSSLSASSVSTIDRSDGTGQLSYHGKPLYLYSLENIVPEGMGYAATGSGNGLKVAGGTFSLVAA
jgi:predicted lipoprotein with Yx(FWY)xxD motif